MYDMIATELFNRPHLVSAARLDALSAYVLSRQGHSIQVPDQPKPMAFAVSDSATWSDNGYYVDSGVAIIDMIGTMVHRGGIMDALSGMTSYSTLSRRFTRAINDPQVNAVFINGDTPGGAVNGAFDFSDKIYNARGVKPIYTLAADCLCSAGVLIGSSADKVFTTQTGMVGSIGVVMKHVDLSKMNELMGINPSYIYAGDHKVDGNSDEPLSNEVKAKFDAEVSQLYSMFVGIVERNTALTAQEIIDTQAAVYLGGDAVTVGLAESVTTAEQLLEDMKTQHGAGRPLFSSTIGMEKQTMDQKEKEKPVSSAEEQGGAVQAATEEGGAAAEGVEVVATVEKGIDEKAIRTEERTRFATIMNSDAAIGRTRSAVNLATKSDMSAEDVIATLGDMPAEAKGGSKLDAAMEQEGSPGIGAEEEGGGEMSQSDNILASYNSARGKQ